MHTINCTYHPYGDESLEDIEKKMTAEVNGFAEYNQHLDSHLGLWVTDLKSILSELEENSQDHYAMKFTSAEETYYSVITQACDGYYIEFFSDKAEGVEKSKFHETKEVRFDFTDFKNPEKDFYPIQVSRATTMIDEMVNFFTEIVKGELLKKETVDGVEIARVKLNNADVILNFVNRPAPEGAKFTVKDLEDYVNSTHDKYVKSTHCGFDQHADHHWAYDQMSWTETLSSVAKKLEAGGHKYRWFSLPGGMHQIYAFDPSGWTFQLDWSDGNDVPSEVATYAADCKSNDGCYGQGICDNESPYFMYEL